MPNILNLFLYVLSGVLIAFPVVIFLITFEISDRFKETFKASGQTLWILNLSFFVGFLINIILFSYYITN